MDSSLVSVLCPAAVSNYSDGRDGRKIEQIAIHHMAGIMTALQCGKIFQNPSRAGSSHYGVGKDGEIGQYVNEVDTAWTNSNWDSNCKSVTIETSNCETGGAWKVSDITLASLIRLVADIAKRNNITLVKGKTLVWHRMYKNTTCPGDYLLSKFDYIIAEANKINNTQQNSQQKLTYKAHVQGSGWLPEVKEDEIAGTVGKSLRMEGLIVNLQGVQVQAHVQGIGWQQPVSSGQIAGTTGKSLRMEAVKLWLTGELAKTHDIIYRVHVQGKGWLQWVKNDTDYAGTVGKSLRAEAIQIKLVNK